MTPAPLGAIPPAFNTFGILFVVAAVIVVICFVLPVMMMRIYLAYKKKKRGER